MSVARHPFTIGGCEACPGKELSHLALDTGDAQRVIALAGNPNTGKSSVFNALTGLRQHTGNWAGKTVARAEGGFAYRGIRHKIVDLPGTYSLLSASEDEEIARDYILFAQPDCTLVVMDATALERNLNLALQVLEVTDRVVVVVNLMDEARRKGIEVDTRQLGRDLGVPVVATSARTGEGLRELLAAIDAVIRGTAVCAPRRPAPPKAVREATGALVPLLERLAPGVPNARWVAYRILDGDYHVRQALLSGELAQLAKSRTAAKSKPVPPDAAEAKRLLARADELRRGLGSGFRDEIVESLYGIAQTLSERCSSIVGSGRKLLFDQRIDRLVTSPILGIPVMLGILAAILWLTIAGANVPSQLLAKGLFWFEDQASAAFLTWGAPEWLTSFLWHGIYRALAWVVAVMLPPMAIFFPCFTILEDLGYLPRVAFNLDALLGAVGAHGKMALTMAMGFGCNAAAVVSTRIIDSPRERLLAILTNNFMPCNGRFPTLVLLATIFVASAFPPGWSSLAAAGAVLLAVLIGVFFTFVTAFGLSRTMLRGVASAFTLELPPYRRPSILRILYTSLIDRTIVVLWRAVAVAVPAGVVAWLLTNIDAGGQSLAAWLIHGLDPFGVAIGLDGVILAAYLLAIPANEIVVPTMLMLYLGKGMMIDAGGPDALREVLVGQHGWTLMTGVCMLLFVVLHHPCGTTLWTIYKETRSRKWTLVAALLPLSLGFLVCFLVATVWRLVG